MENKAKLKSRVSERDKDSCFDNRFTNFRNNLVPGRPPDPRLDPSTLASPGRRRGKNQPVQTGPAQTGSDWSSLVWFRSDRPGPAQTGSVWSGSWFIRTDFSF